LLNCKKYNILFLCSKECSILTEHDKIIQIYHQNDPKYDDYNNLNYTDIEKTIHKIIDSDSENTNDISVKKYNYNNTKFVIDSFDDEYDEDEDYQDDYDESTDSSSDSNLHHLTPVALAIPQIQIKTVTLNNDKKLCKMDRLYSEMISGKIILKK
jgi:hypothetical protein